MRETVLMHELSLVSDIYRTARKAVDDYGTARTGSRSSASPSASSPPWSPTSSSSRGRR